MTAKPYAGQNAIEAVAFVLIYSREFTEQEFEFLLSLEHKLKGILPSFLKLAGLIVNVAESSASKSPLVNQTQKLSGVLLQRFQDNGKPDWALRVNGNQIIVNCWNYSRWDDVWQFAQNLLLSAASSVQSDSNPIGSIALQVVDKFEYENVPSEYNISDVFRSDSPYLTKQAVNAGKFWHVNQGWFEASPVNTLHESRILNVLNLSSSELGGKLVATIDHTGHVQFKEPGVTLSNLELQIEEHGRNVFLTKIFNDLHGSNAQILCRTICVEKLDQIGLKR